jgi:hypothetical protein
MEAMLDFSSPLSRRLPVRTNGAPGNGATPS